MKWDLNLKTINKLDRLDILLYFIITKIVIICRLDGITSTEKTRIFFISFIGLPEFHL